MRVGQRHSAVISKEGQLFTFGNGNWGVLGHGNESNIKFNAPKLVKALAKKNVVDIALGEYHTIALTDDGNVYTWGYAGKKGYFNWMYSQEVGALGHGDKESLFVPKKVQFFQDNGLKVQQIAAGSYHCVALCDDGNLYTWGRGQYGVLGNGDNSYSLEPVLNEEFAYMKKEAEEAGDDFGFRKIDAADEYTAVVLNDGQLYVWGKNDHGQMGVGAGIGIDLVESENIPKEVDLKQTLKEREDIDDLPIVVDVHTGMRTMLILDSEQRLYQTGLKIDWNPKYVRLNSDKIQGKIEQLACGRGHYVIVDSENNVHCFGKIFGKGSGEQYDGYEIFDGDDLFDGGKVDHLSMKYETFGALVKDQ